MPRPWREQGFSRKERLAPVHAAKRAGDVDALVNIVKREPDWIVRVVAIGDLGALGDPRAVEPLRRLLTTGQFNVRVASIRALGRIGDMSASNDLHRLVKNDRENIGIRLTAALASLQLGDRRVVPFIALLVVDDQYSRSNMKWALKKLRQFKGVEATPILQAGGSRRLGLLDRLRVRLLLRYLGSQPRA